MIDWAYVARSALWILGLSVVVAALGYAGWWRRGRGLGPGAALGHPVFLAPFACGMVLFCAGLAWGAAQPWQRGLWALLGLASAAFLAWTWRARDHV